MKRAILLTSIAALTLSVFWGGDAAAQNKPKAGDKFVNFTVQQDPADPSSKVSLSDYVGNGKYVIADFWASWCGPCRREIPYIRNAYLKLPKDKVTVLSIAVADKLKDTQKAAKELDITWEQIVNAGRVPIEAYGIEGIPYIVVFGPDGKILRTDLRGDDIYLFVKGELEK